MKKIIFFTLFFVSIAPKISKACTVDASKEGSTEIYTIKAAAGQSCTIGKALTEKNKDDYLIHDRAFTIKNGTEHNVYARVATDDCDSAGFLLPARVNVTIYRRLTCNPKIISGYTVDAQNKKIADITALGIVSTKHESVKIDPVKIKERLGFGVTRTRTREEGRIEYYPLQINIVDQGNGKLNFEQRIIKSGKS